MHLDFEQKQLKSANKQYCTIQDQQSTISNIECCCPAHSIPLCTDGKMQLRRSTVHLSSFHCMSPHHMLNKPAHFRSKESKQVFHLLIFRQLFYMVYFTMFVALIVSRLHFIYLMFILMKILRDTEMQYGNGMLRILVDEQGTNQSFQVNQFYLLPTHKYLGSKGQLNPLIWLQNISLLQWIFPKQLKIFFLNKPTQHFEAHLNPKEPLCRISNDLNHIEITHQANTTMKSSASSLQYSHKTILVMMSLVIKSSDQGVHQSTFLF